MINLRISGAGSQTGNFLQVFTNSEVIPAELQATLAIRGLGLKRIIRIPTEIIIAKIINQIPFSFLNVSFAIYLFITT